MGGDRLTLTIYGLAEPKEEIEHQETYVTMQCLGDCLLMLIKVICSWQQSKVDVTELSLARKLILEFLWVI